MTAMNLPEFTDEDRVRLMALIGVASVAFRDPRLPDDQRAELAELIGFLSSVAHSEIVFRTLHDLRERVASLESQLVAVQRQSASLN